MIALETFAILPWRLMRHGLMVIIEILLRSKCSTINFALQFVLLSCVCVQSQNTAVSFASLCLRL